MQKYVINSATKPKPHYLNPNNRKQMNLQILPPDLLDEGKPGADTKQKYDRREWFASSLADGESAVFRLLGGYSTGHCQVVWRWAQEKRDEKGELKFAGWGYSKEYPGAVPPDAARAVDWSNPARPKLDNEFVKPRKALVWVAFSEAEQRPVLLIMEQKSLREGLTEILNDEDYSFTDDGIAKFQIKISRKGNGLETSYSILPKVKAPTKVETHSFTEVAETAQVGKLLENGHPFLETTEFKTPEATTASADTEF